MPLFLDGTVTQSTSLKWWTADPVCIKTFNAAMKSEASYTPESWRADEVNVLADDWLPHCVTTGPTAREQSRLFDLLGRINYKILCGNQVYVQCGGIVYKTIYGGYWRSVFTGIEHYLLHCVQVQTPLWLKDEPDDDFVDLPITYSNGGWIANGNSLSFILERE